MTGCVVCGGVDADIKLGWTVCGDCFRIDAPVQDYPADPWVVAARVVAVAMFVFAVIVLVSALGQVS